MKTYDHDGQPYEADLVEGTKFRELEREIARQRDRFNQQVEYSVMLARAVEHHCRGVKVPPEIAIHCPYHAELLNR